MAILDGSLIFLLLATALLAFIIGRLSRNSKSGDSEDILNQKITVLRDTVAEQKQELQSLKRPSLYSGLPGSEPTETEEMKELRFKNQKLIDSEGDLKVKLSQLYAKKQAEINQLTLQNEDLQVDLDNTKDEPVSETKDRVGDLLPVNSDANPNQLEIESQKQTINRLENQLKIESNVYKRRIDELENELNTATKPSVNDDDKFQTFSENLAAKEAELIEMEQEMEDVKNQLSVVLSNTTALSKKKTRKRPTKKVSRKRVAKKTVSKKVQKKKVIAKDDLTKIKGIGPKIKTLLYKNGITRFSQIAAFKKADIKDISDKLGKFGGRIERDEWIQQAKKIKK